MASFSFFSKLGATIKGFLKIIVLSRHAAAPSPSHKGGDEIIVLGNGPSLNDTIARHGLLLASKPTVAVNFMASSPLFNAIKPDYYVLADPVFFQDTDRTNVSELWNALSKTDFPMTLCVPRQRVRLARRLLGKNSGVAVAGFNFVGAGGFTSFEDWAYSSGLAMPRPRNVLIPAIMTAIRAGYKDIYVVGADHSWLETVRVTDNNLVVSIQPHFYTDSKEELDRSAKVYENIRLHQLLESFSIAFRSYHTLQRYAHTHGIRIYNSTPSSYIDAFPHKPLPTSG